MKFSKKNLLAALLASAAIWLGAETSSDGIWHYRIEEDGGLTVTGTSEAKTERLVIPSSIDGKTVTGIADHAFFRYDAAKSIVIPDTVTSIGVSAFESCAGLRELTLPSGLELIPDRCFAGCGSLEEVTVPESVRIIGYMGFAECRSLKKAEISPSLRLIFDFAFAGCPDLDIHIPRPVEVAEDVFYSHDIENKPLLHVFRGSMAEIIAKEYSYDFEYEEEGSAGDVSEWQDYEDYLGVIESFSHIVIEPLTPEQYQDIQQRISVLLKSLDMSYVDTVRRTSDGLVAWYSEGEYTQLADISGDVPFVVSIWDDGEEGELLIVYAGTGEYSKDCVMLYMYPDLEESYGYYYDSLSYDFYSVMADWYSGPKPASGTVLINGREYFGGILEFLAPEPELVSPAELASASGETETAAQEVQETAASKNEGGRVVVEFQAAPEAASAAEENAGEEDAESEGVSLTFADAETPARNENAEYAYGELDEDIEEYSTADFIGLVHDLTRIENSAVMVPDSVEGIEIGEGYYISDGDNLIYFAPFARLPYIYIRIGQDDMNYALILAGPNSNVYRSVILSSGRSVVGQNADRIFDNAELEDLYDFIRSEFPFYCITKTTIHGKDYSVYCGMDDYDSSMDVEFLVD